MTDYSPRLFHTDAEIEHIGEGLIARTLPRARVDPRGASRRPRPICSPAGPTSTSTSELPGFIRAYNESVGGVNSDSEGYHETITRVFLHGVRLFLAEADRKEPLHELVNELLLSPMGRRDWPLRFYSRERLFSVEARRNIHPARHRRAALGLRRRAI